MSLHSQFKKVLAKTRFSHIQVNFKVLKMGKKSSLSNEKRTQIVTLSKSKFSVHAIAKKVKVSKTAAHNAIMKYQNEGTFINRKRSFQYFKRSFPNVFSIAATKDNTFFCFAERVLIIHAAVLQMRYSSCHDVIIICNVLRCKTVSTFQKVWRVNI